MTRRERMAGRRGFTLLETLLALLLGWLVTSLALATLARQREMQVGMSRRADALAATRTARHLITRELRTMGPDEVKWRLPADSLSIRAYRGVAVVCPGGGAARELAVQWEGLRAPEAAKDSVWVLGANGEEKVVALVETLAPRAPCMGLPEASGALWVLSDPPPDQPLLSAYFERGTFHLSDGALRYRRGEGGRQPVTPESFLTPPSSFEPWGDGVVARLVPDGSPGRIESIVGSTSISRAPGGG